RARVERPPQFIVIERPGRRMQADKAANGAAQLRVRPIILIERFEDNHFIALVQKREQAGHHSFGCSAAYSDLALRIEIELIKAVVVLANRVPKRLQTPSDRVLIDIGPNGLLSGLLDDGRGAEIREALGQIDGAELV